jgi:hypothetical protein
MKIISIVLICFLLLGCDRAEQEVIVIPKDYTGYVLIIYNHPNGAAPVYENGKRIYNIPANGILKTKFSPNPDWMEFPEFYYGNIAPENRIPFEADMKTLPIDRIVAYGGTAGSINKDSTGKEKIKILTYHIGNKAQIDSSYEKVQKLDILKLSE